MGFLKGLSESFQEKSENQNTPTETNNQISNEELLSYDLEKRIHSLFLQDYFLFKFKENTTQLTLHSDPDNFEDDFESYVENIQMNPYDTSSYTLLAHLYCYKEDYESAIELLKKALEIDPDYPFSIYEEMLPIYNTIGDFEKTNKLGKIVVKNTDESNLIQSRNPDSSSFNYIKHVYPELSYNLAVSAFQMKDYDETLEWLERSENDLKHYGVEEGVIPTDSKRYDFNALEQINFLQGYTYFKLENYDEAYLHFKKTAHFSNNNQLLESIPLSIEENFQINKDPSDTFLENQNSLKDANKLGSQPIDYLFVSSITLTNYLSEQNYKNAEIIMDQLINQFRTIDYIDFLGEKTSKRWELATQDIGNIEDFYSFLGNCNEEKSCLSIINSSIEMIYRYRREFITENDFNIIRTIGQTFELSDEDLLEIVSIYQMLYGIELNQEISNQEYFKSNLFLNADIYFIWAIGFTILRYKGITDDDISIFSSELALLIGDNLINLGDAKKYFLERNAEDMFNYIGKCENPALIYFGAFIATECILKKRQGSITKEEYKFIGSFGQRYFENIDIETMLKVICQKYQYDLKIE